MVDLNNPVKVLKLIDHFACARSNNDKNCNCVSFHCLIEECEYNSINLGDLMSHADEHITLKWEGFCYACNVQIYNEGEALMKELLHMTTNNYHGIGIEFQMLPGDNLPTLQEAVIKARAERLSRYPKPSTSSSIQNATILFQVPNETSTTTTVIQSDVPSSTITNLACYVRHYTESEISLKIWKNEPSLKTPEICKKMLTKACLYALYKCMDIDCLFTTSKATTMLIHLQSHANSWNSQKEHQTKRSNWLECAYCDVISNSCSSLVQHIQDEHGSSIYQCPYCFYRSCVSHNVLVHLKQFHQSEKKLVLVCNGKEILYETEKALIEESRLKNIRPLRCSGACNKIAYVMDYFINHMKSSTNHADEFKCHRCGSLIPLSEALKHFLLHEIGVYQCIYCNYGVNTIESIQKHMCSHPSKLPLICVRLTRKNRILSDEELRSVESTLICQLGQTVDSELFETCPVTEEYLSGTRSRSSPVTSCTSLSDCRLPLNDVLTYNDLEKEYISDDWDEYFAKLSITSLAETQSIIDTAPYDLVDETVLEDCEAVISQCEVPVLVTCKNTVSDVCMDDSSQCGVDRITCNLEKAADSENHRADVPESETDIAAYNLVKKTGKKGRELYRCSLANCDEEILNIAAFYGHLFKHNSPERLRCYHCNVKCETVDSLKKHIQVHNIHRFFCYDCEYTSSVNDKEHMRLTHNKEKFQTIPLNPMKDDINKDMFIMCHSRLGEDEVNQFGVALIERSKRQSSTDIQAEQYQMNQTRLVDKTTMTVKKETELLVHPVTELYAGNGKSMTNPESHSIISISDDDEPPPPKPSCMDKDPKTPIIPIPVPTSLIPIAIPLPATTAPALNKIVTYGCCYCPNTSDNPKIIKDHWKKKHNRSPTQFTFKILKIFKCHYCKRSNTFEELKNHIKKQHPKNQFAMVDNLYPEKCGLCNQNCGSGTEIIDHFMHHHHQVGNPIKLSNYLTTELIDRINDEILPECTHCQDEFASLTELEKHTNEKHPESEMNFIYIYGCSEQCHVTAPNERDMVAHIRQHFLHYQCNFCDEKFLNIDLVREHHRHTHSCEDKTYRIADVKQYGEMKIIFPNGLVLTKSECINTRFGSMDKVIEFHNELHDKDMEAVTKRENEKRQSVLQPPTKVVKKVEIKNKKQGNQNSDREIAPPRATRKRKEDYEKKQRKLKDQKVPLKPLNQ